MEIINIQDKKALQKALEYLNKGEIVIYPTETCYGVGVDATNSNAVTKVLEYKKRPEGKAISVAVSSMTDAGKYVEINSTAQNIYENFLPGPVTIISKSKSVTDKRLESEKGTLGIRIPDNEFFIKLLTEFGKPVTSTSANSAGKKTPYKVDDILQNISEKQKSMIGLIIDADELPHNPPSTVIDTTTDELTSYRQGNIILGNVNSEAQDSNSSDSWTSVGERISTSNEETIQIGTEIMKNLFSQNDFQPMVLLLDGSLGAGKTQLVKGFASALDIKSNVKSPTYTYMTEYPFQVNGKSGKLFHIDAWRIKSKEDLAILGFEKLISENNILAIEWPSVLNALDLDLGNANLYLIKIQDMLENRRKIFIYERKET